MELTYSKRPPKPHSSSM